MIGNPVEALPETIALRGAVADMCNAMFDPALGVIWEQSSQKDGFQVRRTLFLGSGQGIATHSDEGEFLGRLWYRVRKGDIWVVHFQVSEDPKGERLILPKRSDSMCVFPRISSHDFDRSPHSGLKASPDTYEVPLDLLRNTYVPSLNKVLTHYGQTDSLVPIPS